MSDKVLFVDDEPNVLLAFHRQFRGLYDIETAPGGLEGLSTVKTKGPFAVVVSDLRMPVMDGIQFLSRVHEAAPDTVRVMLTGNADVEAAVSAVNEGNIFRFLTKPATSETLQKALDAAIRQHKLIIAERELLQKTLAGSVNVMVDVLSLACPAAFSRASRVARVVNRITAKLNLKDAWQYELAATLSQIGCIAIPTGILERIYSGESLSTEDRSMFDSHPSIGGRLLGNIPRLGLISEMIARQNEPYNASENSTKQSAATTGARLLHLALDYDALIEQGLDPTAAQVQLRSRKGMYDPAMLDVLDESEYPDSHQEERFVRIRDLITGSELKEDVWTKSGILLVKKGHEVTPAVIERLRMWARMGQIIEPIRAIVPVRPTPSQMRKAS